MILIKTLALATVAVLLLQLYRVRLRKIRMPVGLKHDNDMVNYGLIPSRLYGIIPYDYEEREDYSMNSTVNTIFVDGNLDPMWCLSVNLFAGKTHSKFDVIYDHTGEIHQY